MSAKFDRDAHNGSVSIMFTQFLPYKFTVTLTFELWPPKSIVFILLPWLTVRKILTLKYTTVQSLSCSQCYFHICQLWPLPLTSKINRVHPLVIVNMSVKFDEDVHNSLVFIVFTRIRCDALTDWLTDGRTYWWNHGSVTISPPQRVVRG